MNAPQILWITTIIMLLGGLAILATGKRRTASEGLHTVLHGIVPLIAACSYFAMATGQGMLPLPTFSALQVGQVLPIRIFYFARYIDWVFTTPLLLISLGLVAMRRGQKRPGALVGAVLSDVMMIVTAFAFGLSILPFTKWMWFLISCVAFLGVYYALWVPAREASLEQRADVRDTYRKHATLLSVLWLAYPIVLAVAPDGLNILGDTPSVLVIAVLDVIAKVVFGFMAVKADAAATTRDLAEGAPALNRAA